MSAMASQSTGFPIAYSTICSGEDEREHQSHCLRHWPLWGEFGEFLAQQASNTESVSIWWRHHEYIMRFVPEGKQQRTLQKDNT